MKNLKKWVSRTLAGVIAMMCFVGNSAPLYSRAAESTSTVTISETDSGDSVIQYVALGDSITAGSDTYVSQVSAYLKGRYGECQTKNLAIDGMTSSHLVDCLTNSSNSYYSTMRNAIKNADVITIDIGSNDIMGTAMEVFAAGFGATPDQMGAVAEKWEKRIQSANTFQLFLLYLEALSIARNINYELNYGDAMPNALATFETNFNKIMTVIEQLAPDAKVYIGNLYNPYVGAAAVYCGDFEVVDLEEFARTNILKANVIIANNAKGNKIVDLYNVINNPKYIKGDVANYDYDPHPNADGQKAIAAKFIAVMSTDN